MKEETRLKKKKEIYSKIRKWLEEHEKVFPKQAITKEGKIIRNHEQTDSERYEVTLARNWANYSKEDKELFEKYMQLDIDKVPEEYRIIIEALRLKKESPEKYDLRKKYKKEKKNSTWEQIIKWLEEHDGIMPRSAITRNSQKVSRIQMTQEELKEVKLYLKWKDSEEKRILEKYIETPSEKLPEEYQKQIMALRSYGYGVKEENCFEEIIKWLNENQGRFPRTNLSLKRKLTEKEKYEKSLRRRWEKSEEKLILEKYTGKRLSSVPKEYREKIEILRSYGYGLTKEEIDEQLFKWIKDHNGILPRQVIREKNVPKKTSELTLEEHKEIMLRKRWLDSIYRKLLKEYKGKAIEDVPEKYRKKIEFLREFGLDREKIEHGNPYEELIEWLKTHNGTLPRSAINATIKSGTIFVDGKKRRVKLSKYMTEEEHYELSLSHRWFRCEERQIFLEYQDKPISDIPEEYKEKVEILKKLIKTSKERCDEREKEIFEEIVIWLEEHNNKPPRAKINRNGKILNRFEVNEEEKYENRLYSRWADSKIKKVLDEYYGKDIEDVPEEYRERISILREHGLIGKNPIIAMKSSVKKQVGSNSVVRQELGSEVLRRKLKEKDE